MTEITEGGPFVCGSCGKGEDVVETFVVTTLDYEDPHQWRTEVCVPCWNAENLPIVYRAMVLWPQAMGLGPRSLHNGGQGLVEGELKWVLDKAAEYAEETPEAIVYIESRYITEWTTEDL